MYILFLGSLEPPRTGVVGKVVNLSLMTRLALPCSSQETEKTLLQICSVRLGQYTSVSTSLPNRNQENEQLIQILDNWESGKHSLESRAMFTWISDGIACSSNVRIRNVSNATFVNYNCTV